MEDLVICGWNAIPVKVDPSDLDLFDLDQQ